jgi:manganese-dependent inorganic pyrophosphatase
MSTESKKVWVVGHKNPDTDSICAAISYAYLKNQSGDKKTYVAKRAGAVNEETHYVLERFGVEEPPLVSYAGAQIKDINIRKTAGVSNQISLKRAWELMKKLEVVTLPVTNQFGKLEGVIVTKDIATSYMDVLDNCVLSKARTQYKTIAETIDGEVYAGNEHAHFVRGKVVIATSNPEYMADYIEDDDLVILGDREEAQMQAIRSNASCIIIGGGLEVAEEVKKLAEKRDCVIITTPFDTFSVARLINQSMPIKQYMTRRELVTFDIDDYVDDVKDVMSRVRHRDFPVLGSNGNYVGMISRRNLMNMQKKQIILVDHNEKSQAVDGIGEAEILEIIDHHRLGSLETVSPVYFRNQPLGCTSTIIYQMYQEQRVEIPKEIAGLLLSAIISDTLMFRSPTCTERDKEAAQELAKIAKIEIESFANKMFRAGSNLSSKTPEEIFYQDYKKFIVDDLAFGVGQISFMSEEELQTVKDRLMPYMEKECGKHGIKMVFFMLTNIIKESTELLCYGEGSDGLVYEAFGEKVEDSSCRLEGVVSRKKQLIPKFMNALQQ